MRDRYLRRHAGDFVDDWIDSVGFSSASDNPEGDDDSLGAGEGLAQGVEKLADRALERMMAAFRAQKRSIDLFASQLSKLASSIQAGKSKLQPIYVFVDELDRCRPLYAIRLLETVKHLFSVRGVVFIIATDTQQLSHSVRAVYGADFEGKKYLHRFFDRTYSLRTPSKEQLIASLLSSYNLPMDKLSSPETVSAQALCAAIFKDFDCSLRDIEQCFDILQTVCTLWSQKVQIELAFMLALIVLYHSGETQTYLKLSGQQKARFDPPPVAQPSILFSEHSSSGASRITTWDLLAAYRTAIDQPLTRHAAGDLPSGGAARAVVRRLNQEFFAIHNRVTVLSNEPKSVLNDYHKYIELAVQFQRPEISTDGGSQD